jgi:hypothetical protein
VNGECPWRPEKVIASQERPFMSTKCPELLQEFDNFILDKKRLVRDGEPYG